jgi:hypothetical protein
MPSSSNPPVANVRRAPKYLRPELEKLVRALAALQEPDRATVVAAANEQAQRDRKGPTISLDDWETTRWVLGLGGNAVEDCNWLYDDPGDLALR